MDHERETRYPRHERIQQGKEQGRVKRSSHPSKPDRVTRNISKEQRASRRVAPPVIVESVFNDSTIHKN
jgi:hypothetical protein